MALHLKIVTPERTLTDVDVSELTAPGTAGEFGVLPQHVTFLGGLDVGVLVYVENGQRRRVVVDGGYAEVENESVTVLADRAEEASEIDPSEAGERLAAAQRALDEGADTPDEVDVLLRSVKSARARVEAVSAT
jgi:F-type H+-transporting ATPase subunit epsilon